MLYYLFCTGLKMIMIMKKRNEVRVSKGSFHYIAMSIRQMACDAFCKVLSSFKKDTTVCLFLHFHIYYLQIVSYLETGFNEIQKAFGRRYHNGVVCTGVDRNF